MSGGVSGPQILASFKAAGDLSSYQYCFVYIDANGKCAACGANGKAVGILQNKPDAANEECRVALPGSISNLKVNEPCDESEHLTSTSAALGEVVDAGDEFSGAMALQAATAQNDIIKVLVTHCIPAASEAG
jgi:hypothetical protein